jgi:hypothetical protein
MCDSVVRPPSEAFTEFRTCRVIRSLATEPATTDLLAAHKLNASDEANRVDATACFCVGPCEEARTNTRHNNRV